MCLNYHRARVKTGLQVPRSTFVQAATVMRALVMSSEMPTKQVSEQGLFPIALLLLLEAIDTTVQHVKSFLNYVTTRNVLFHTPEQKDTSPLIVCLGPLPKIEYCVKFLVHCIVVILLHYIVFFPTYFSELFQLT